MSRASRLRPLAQAVLRTQADDRLVALAREGREAAFEEIVRRYRPGLVAFAAAYAPADRAEDVVQESLVRSWEALGKGTEEIHLKAWLYTIVRNRALNARRDAKMHEPLSDQIDGVGQPHEIVLGREELDAVVGAVGALPEPQRTALVRSALEGHTHEQIADALGASPGAVRQLIYRARLNLRTGVGMLIPLPLVRLLAEHGTETATATATGMAAGGAAIGAAGGTGASALTKFAAVAAIGTFATGAGVAIDRANDDEGRRPVQTVAEELRDGRGGTAAVSQTAATSPAGEDSAGQGSDDSSGHGSGDDRSGERSDDDSGHGSGDSGAGDSSGHSASSGTSSGSLEGGSDDGSGSHSSGPGPAGGDDDPAGADHDNSGPGGGGGSGHSGSGSSGSGSSGSGHSGSGTSGSGSSGSGHSGSGTSGSGSSGSGSTGSGSGSDDPAEALELLDDDSSGSGSSGSGSSESGSGGGGSGSGGLGSGHDYN